MPAVQRFPRAVNATSICNSFWHFIDSPMVWALICGALLLAVTVQNWEGMTYLMALGDERPDLEFSSSKIATDLSYLVFVAATFCRAVITFNRDRDDL